MAHGVAIRAGVQVGWNGLPAPKKMWRGQGDGGVEKRDKKGKKKEKNEKRKLLTRLSLASVCGS